MADHIFQADSIYLRPFEPDDTPALHAYLSHPALASRRYIPWGISWELPLRQAQAADVIGKWAGAERQLNLAVVLSESDAIIGHARADWGWDTHVMDVQVVIDPACWRKGYGSQALDLILTYVFQQTVAHNVSTWIAEWNAEGLAFAPKHGFTDVGRERRSGVRDGAYFDTVVLDMLRPEWLARQGGA